MQHILFLTLLLLNLFDYTMHRFKKKLKSILHSSLICPYNIENKFYTTQSNSYRGDTYKKILKYSLEIFTLALNRQCDDCDRGCMIDR